MPLGSILGSIAGATANYFSQRRQNRENREAVDRQNAFNVQMWNRQNVYNHPSQQMARLKAAGLNPHLIYGTSPSSAVGNSATAPRMEAARMDYENPLRDAAIFSQIRNTEAQTDNLAAARNLTELKAVHQSLVSAGQVHRNTKLGWQAQFSKELIETSLEAQKATVNNILARTATEGHRSATEAARTMKTTREAEYMKHRRDILGKQWERFNEYGIDPDAPASWRLGAELFNFIKSNFKTDNWYDDYYRPKN